MTIVGTPDADTLTGTAEDDRIEGLAGNDTLDGLEGGDSLLGGPGNDVLSGGDGTDDLSGEDGDDALSGGAGYDLLAGGAGNDAIDGGGGIDTLVLSGQPGDYLIHEIAPATDTTPGVYSITDLKPRDGVDTFTNIERIRFPGRELPLADMLNRAPTDIVLEHVPATGPKVFENAAQGTLVAVLSGVDPDPGDVFT